MEIKLNNHQAIGIDPGMRRFQFAVTCVHEGDSHCVAVTTTADQMQSLQHSAPGIFAKLQKETGLDPRMTSYFELHPDGKVFKVNYDNITAPPEHSHDPVMVPRRGEWTEIEEVNHHLRDAVPPHVLDQTPDLSESRMPRISQAEREQVKKTHPKL